MNSSTTLLRLVRFSLLLGISFSSYSIRGESIEDRIRFEDKETISNVAERLANVATSMSSSLDTFETDMRVYWDEHPTFAKELATASFLELGAKTGAAQSACEVCVYVLENKQQHQPFLCRGLKSPSQQQTCVSVLVSLMWWLENQVYWVNYGCQRSGDGGAWEWVKPCPAHAICGFLQSLYDRSPFCPPDPKYRKPSAG